MAIQKWIFIVLLINSVQAKPIGQHSSEVVTDLLTTLFRQTIYHRIENLLLDPGRQSNEKQQIIDSAVDNYHKQKMVMPPSMSEDSTSERTDSEITTDLTNLTGKDFTIVPKLDFHQKPGYFFKLLFSSFFKINSTSK